MTYTRTCIKYCKKISQQFSSADLWNNSQKSLKTKHINNIYDIMLSFVFGRISENINTES